MKLPRIRYNTKLEEILTQINNIDLNESIRDKKNKLMESLESSKDDETLKHLIRDWLYAFMDEFGELKKLNSEDEKEQMSIRMNMLMNLDEISYLGWLRYQMILGKKVEK